MLLSGNKESSTLAGEGLKMAGKFREHLRIRSPPQRGGAAWPRFRAVCARLGAPLGPGFQQRHGHQTDTCPSALQDAQYSWVSGPRSPDTYSEAHTRTLGSPATPPPCQPSRARLNKPHTLSALLTPTSTLSLLVFCGSGLARTAHLSWHSVLGPLGSWRRSGFSTSAVLLGRLGG